MLFVIAFWLSALEAVIAIGYLLTIPSDPKNAFLFGLSAQRLALALLFTLLFVFCAVMGWLIFKYSASFSSRITLLFNKRLVNGLILAMLPVFLSGWVFTFLPSYRLGLFHAYFERLQPFIVWMMLTSIQLLTCISIWRWGFNKNILLKEFHSSKTVFVVAAISFLTCVIIWLLIIFTGAGLIPDSVHWNEVGVPILGIQVIASIILGLVFYFFFFYLDKKSNSFRRFFQSKSWIIDVLIGFLIWATAAFLWNIVPQEKSFFAPGPYPPNQAFYPYSDAALYDTSAQLALIGEGLNAGGYVDKPLYSAFLVLLNLIAGEHFDLVVIMQVMALAFLPVISYWLGKSLHSRGLGISLALMIIFKQYNAIRSTVWISTSTSRMLMSEVPTALFVAVFTLWVFLWIKNRGQKPWQAMIAGGVLGLSTMVRHNVWLLLPVTILMAWLAFGIKGFRKWLFNSALLIFVLFMSIAPWSWRLVKNGGSPLNVLTPLIGTIWKNRYLPSIETPQASPTDLLQTSEPIDSSSE